MAMGVPVVSTRISGIPEMIDDGVHGLLVEPRDAPALAAGAAARADRCRNCTAAGRGRARAHLRALRFAPHHGGAARPVRAQLRAAAQRVPRRCDAGERVGA
jgi:glycosyltransferase involved in cell wall biosynthesis